MYCEGIKFVHLQLIPGLKLKCCERHKKQLNIENKIKIGSYCAEHNCPLLKPEDGDTLSLQN